MYTYDACECENNSAEAMSSEGIVGGLEGGATQSTVVLLNSAGDILAKVKGPGTNHYLLGRPECERIISEMVNEAKRMAKIPESVPLAAMGISMSGCEREDTNREIISEIKATYPSLSKEYVVESDTMGSINCVSQQGGIVCISGTGSNTLLINTDGSKVNCGGFGHLLGDEGSGWAISHRIVKICIDALDNYKAPPHPIDETWKLLKSYFKIEHIQDFLNIYYADFDKAKIAGVCKDLAALATSGDKLCQMVFEEAGSDLARAIAAVAPKASNELKTCQGGVHVLCVGSVWLGWDLLKPGFISYLEKNSDISEISLLRASTSLALGAAYMAADKHNVTIKRDYTKNYNVFFKYTKK